LQSLARAQAASSRPGGHLMGQDILEAVTAEVLLATGRVEEALAHAEATIELAREEVGGILSEGIAERVRGSGAGTSLALGGGEDPSGRKRPDPALGRVPSGGGTHARRVGPPLPRPRRPSGGPCTL
jgi:hypothetical protein